MTVSHKPFQLVFKIDNLTVGIGRLAVPEAVQEIPRLIPNNQRLHDALTRNRRTLKTKSAHNSRHDQNVQSDPKWDSQQHPWRLYHGNQDEKQAHRGKQNRPSCNIFQL